MTVLPHHPGLGVGQGGVGGVVGREVLQEPGGGVEAQPARRADVGQPHPAGALEHPARSRAGAPGPVIGPATYTRREIFANAVDSPPGAWSDARTRVADLGTTRSKEPVTMTTETHTMAGRWPPPVPRASAPSPLRRAPLAPPSRHVRRARCTRGPATTSPPPGPRAPLPSRPPSWCSTARTARPGPSRSSRHRHPPARRRALREAAGTARRPFSFSGPGSRPPPPTHPRPPTHHDIPRPRGQGDVARALRVRVPESQRARARRQPRLVGRRPAATTWPAP